MFWVLGGYLARDDKESEALFEAPLENQSFKQS